MVRVRPVSFMVALCLLLGWAATCANSAIAQAAGKGNPAGTAQEGGKHAGPSTAPVAGQGAATNPAGGAANASNQGAANAAPPDTQTPKDAAAPKIAAIVPAAPPIAPNEPLVLEGSGFAKDAKDNIVTFVDPSGNAYAPAKVVDVNTDSGRLTVIATLGMAGKWSVTVAAAGGAKSNAYAFPVEDVEPVVFQSPRVYAFAAAAVVASLFLLAITAWMLWAIHSAQTAKAEEDRWSLTDALSEESICQPKEIRTKKDVILLASSSRLIALIGLMGILSTVLGIGYCIMWNLMIYGTVPDLSGVQAFLLGSATLFAPYLANKISDMVTPSSKPQAAPANGQTGAGLAVTALAPTSPTANPAPQPIHLIGTGFQGGVSATLTDPAQVQRPVAAGDITAVSNTQVSLNAVLNTPGAWKATIANAGAGPGTSVDFKVTGPPTIDSLDNAAGLTHGANAQALTFRGSGFMSELTVKITDPAGAASTLTPSQLTATQVVVSAALTAGGQWRVQLVNPGNQGSAAFPVNVA